MNNWKAVLFDMDGILVNSEPFWRKAMVKVFTSYGISFTEDDCRLTTGKRIDEVVHFWSLNRPFSGSSNAQVVNEIIDELCFLLLTNDIEMNGVKEAISACEQAKLKIALATSSSMRIIDCVLERLNLINVFSVIESAERLPFGKPHPQVFLNCAARLNITSSDCVVIEDSVNGVIAGKAADMYTIAIPEEKFQNDPRFSIADLQLRSLMQFKDFLQNNRREISIAAY
jgi:mannitol-1-/sugar-/sorbitol-6-/2-deoxyglucose-6-phosphatase